MQVLNVAWYFLMSALFIGVAALIVRWSGFYQQRLNTTSGSRFEMLDGLRGFLALGVFFHHAVINYFYQLNHVWRAPDSQFYTMCGQVGVSFFFILTAFLFWTKVLVADGDVKWRTLYLSRVKRIVPMYVVSVFLLLVLVFIKSDWVLKSNFLDVIRDSLKWFAFALLGSPDINQLEHTFKINAGVFWTLEYEWKYYLSLPFLAFFFQYKKLVLFYFFATIFIYLADQKVVFYFLAGMLAAQIQHNAPSITQRFSPRVNDWIFVATIVILFAGFKSAYGLLQAVVAMIGFVALLNGKSVFGFFTLMPVRLLGEISYSIYLLHGIVITVCFLLLEDYMNSIIANNSYWLLVAVIGTVLVLFSSLTYRWVEYKYMHVRAK